MSRCRDPQVQVGEKYSYLLNLETELLQIMMNKRTFNLILEIVILVGPIFKYETANRASNASFK